MREIRGTGPSPVLGLVVPWDQGRIEDQELRQIRSLQVHCRIERRVYIRRGRLRRRTTLPLSEMSLVNRRPRIRTSADTTPENLQAIPRFLYLLILCRKLNMIHLRRMSVSYSSFALRLVFTLMRKFRTNPIPK